MCAHNYQIIAVRSYHSLVMLNKELIDKSVNDKRILIKTEMHVFDMRVKNRTKH